jgi:hypothetical protein
MKPLWLFLLLAAGVSQHYMLDFGAVIDTTMMANVVETNPSEAADLLTWGLLGNVLLVVGPAALWLVPLRVKRLAPAQAVLRVAPCSRRRSSSRSRRRRRCTACSRRWCATTWACATCRTRSSRSGRRCASSPSRSGTGRSRW